MSSPFKNVTVVGGSGNVGKHAVESLLKEGFTVSVLSRESSSYSPPEGVKLIKTDYSHSSLLEALRGQDVVVSVVALNEDALKLQIPIIDAAIEAGVRRFIPSEWGTDPRETVSRKRLPQFAVKTTVYNHLVKLAEEGKIEFTTFATGPFLAPPVLKFFLAADIPSRTLNVWDEKKADIKISTTTVPAIGHAIAKSLTPELAGQFVNKPVFIHSASFTARTVRAAFEKATGSKWEVKNVDIDALLEEKTKALHEGDLGALRDVIRGVLLDPELQPDFEVAAGPGEETSEILGVPKADIEELVKQVVQEESS